MTAVVAAHVWTYWLAPPLFAAAVLLDITIAVLYFKRFVLPRLVVRLVEDDHVVEHPIRLRPARRSDEQARMPRSSAA
jgi:hypothetical protein